MAPVNTVECDRKGGCVHKRKQPTVAMPMCDDCAPWVSMNRLDAGDCRREAEDYASEQKAEETVIDLTRIRLQRAFDFYLHRGSLPEITAGRRPQFGAKPRPKFR